MSTGIYRYFLNGNTAKGYVQLSESTLKEVQQAFILTGGPGVGKSTILNRIGQSFEGKSSSLEYVHSPQEPEAIDGVILKDLGVAILDECLLPQDTKGTNLEFVHLSEGVDANQLAIEAEQIKQLRKEVHFLSTKAYESFAQSLAAHDDLEDIYISNMDFTKADYLAEELIHLIVGEEQKSQPTKAIHRFLGAATPQGAKDFIQDLTQDLHRRYFIKGRAGSGKSTMLKKIAKAGEEAGLQVEVYHCGFDPDSLDMVVIREHNVAIFDSTAPHEYFPERDTDRIVDVYARCITPETDELYAEEIARTTKAYKDKMKEAINLLKEAQETRNQLKTLYTNAVNYEVINQIEQQILEKLNA